MYNITCYIHEQNMSPEPHKQHKYQPGMHTMTWYNAALNVFIYKIEDVDSNWSKKPTLVEVLRRCSARSVIKAPNVTQWYIFMS